MPGDPESLIGIAQAVADGRAVDWPAAESSTENPSDRDLVLQLHVLASVAEVHRQASTTSDSAEEKELDLSGSRWGALEVGERIGGGSFGSVYRAWDPRLAREVALKLLPARTVDDRLMPAVIEEGRLLARLRHPHVITVYGADRFNGRVGIWMELIRGRTIEELLSQHGPLSAQEAAGIGRDLCGALAAVHRSGLVHRDVKTQNVMRQEGGRIVLMDFGAGQEVTSIDGARRAAGTPLYMAPELLAGSPATPQSDLYSVGVLLFRVVTGEYPVHGPTADSVRRAHERGERRRLIDLRPDLPRDFVQVVEQALDPNPSRRFDTAGSMESALAQAFEYTAPADVMAHAPMRRRRWSVAIAVSAVALVLTGLTPAVRKFVTATFFRPPVINIAVLPFASLSGGETAEYFADGVTEILISRLWMASSLRVISPSSVKALPQAERSPAILAARLGASYVVEGSVDRQADRVRIVVRLVEASTASLKWTQAYERSLGDLFALEGEMAAAIGTEIGARLSGDTKRRMLGSQTSSVQAQEAYLQGRYLIYTFNRARFGEARQLFERAIALDPQYAIAHASLARTYGLLLDGDLAPASELVPLATLASQRAYESSPELAETNVALADSKYKYERDWEAADAAYKRAIAAAPNASIVRAPYARFLCALGRLDEAREHAIAGASADPLSAEMIAAIGVTHYYRREFDDALRYYEQAASLSPGYGPVYFGMARVHSARQDYPAAIDHVRKAMSLVGENPTYRAELARNYALGGWRNSAEQVLGGLLRAAADGSSGVSYEGIGYVFAALGDNDRAFEWLNRAMDHYFARLLFIKVDPRADPLRDDRRFPAILDRLGLRE